MTNSAFTATWRVYADAQAVASQAAGRIAALAHEVLQRRHEFTLVLPGGRTPTVVFQQLARVETDWSRWRIYFGDERCVAAEDPLRNSRAAEQAWFSRLSGSRPRIHPIPAEQGPESAALAYESMIRAVLPFDMVLLGMGEDGHTASLFPGFDEPDSALVLPVYEAPKPPAQRVSLSSAALSDAHSVLILVTGSGKREAVERWRQGEPLPVSRIHARHSLEILLDAAAAGGASLHE